jgi:hypothetical protein
MASTITSEKRKRLTKSSVSTLIYYFNPRWPPRYYGIQPGATVSVSGPITSRPFTHLYVRRRYVQIPSFSFNLTNKFRRNQTSRSYPATPMEHPEISEPIETVVSNLWPTLPQQNSLRPRPATIHETGFSCCLSGKYSSLPAWDSSTMPMQSAHGLPQMYSVQQDFYPTSGVSNSALQFPR